MRSRSYPALSLQSALTVIQEARPLGRTIAKTTLSTIGRSDAKGSVISGAFIRKISALTQFGLIQTEGNNINFTDTAEAILYFKDEGEKKQNLIKAFLSPSAFYDLYNDLSKNIPINTNHIRNKAIREIGIAEAAVNSFITNFIQSGVFANLIKYDSEDKQTITLIDPTNEEPREEKTIVDEQNKEKIKEYNVFESFFGTQKEAIREELQTATLILSGGKATVQVPKTMTEKDKARLKAQIDVFLTSEEK